MNIYRQLGRVTGAHSVRHSTSAALAQAHRGRSHGSGFTSLACVKMTGFIGAEVPGVQLGNLSEGDKQGIRDLLLKHSVLVFRDQDLSLEKHLELAGIFGEPEPHPIVKGRDDYPDILEWTRAAGKPTDFGEAWHTDNSYQERPTGESLLLGVDIPSYGNDTLFTSTHHAYESLSTAMKDLLSTLDGVHAASKAFNTDTKERQERFSNKGEADRQYNSMATDLTAEREHPVVRVHPVSGKKCIYVNSMFTTRFKGMTEEESAGLLQFLWSQITRPEFQCRVRWQPNTFVMWDNRTTQHMALNDNFEHARTMRRVTVKGEAPLGTQ